MQIGPLRGPKVRLLMEANIGEILARKHKKLICEEQFCVIRIPNADGCSCCSGLNITPISNPVKPPCKCRSKADSLRPESAPTRRGEKEDTSPSPGADPAAAAAEAAFMASPPSSPSRRFHALRLRGGRSCGLSETTLTSTVDTGYHHTGL